MATTPLTPKETSRVQKFVGVITEVSKVALPPGGMQEQINVTSEQRGLLRSRDALRPVTFDE